MENSSQLVFDYSNLLFSEQMPVGIKPKLINDNADYCKLAHKNILKQRQDDILGFYDLPDKDLHKITEFAARARGRFDNLVVLGIGGSALGNSALYSALKTEKDLNKKVYVIDNVDPDLLFEVLQSIDLEKTVFNVITKSGTTAETMSIFMIVLDILKKRFPDSYKEHLVITTDKEKGFLRALVNKDGYADFIVPDNVGGRFSVLSDVGLVSSAFAGIDVKSLLEGAAAMRSRCSNPDIFANPAYLNGLLHYLYMRKNRNIAVTMPYSNALYLMADWYRQLWAESLGKKYTVDGSTVYCGQTPVKALGTTDQHSQVQLYTQGPDDKIITLVQVKSFNKDYVIPNMFAERDEVNYLGNKKLSTLLNTECLATEIALYDAGKPNCKIIMPEINEYHLGEFIFMHEVQTVFAGELLRINPLDQPGVEAGKVATYAMMGKKGYNTSDVEKYIENKRQRGKLV